MEISTGTHVGPYEIVGRVGAGGMGEVYRARDRRLERDVAIKVLPPDLSENEKALSRFRREAKALAALSHPNILTIHDIGEHDGQVYVVMELLKGQTLRNRITGSSLSWEKAVEIMTAVNEGLAAAHSHGIVHRDLKPENIFITGDERVKILDFGLAKRFDSEELQTRSELVTESQATADGTILGTVPYMSPEQARGEPLDPQSDIFSTGSVLYELLTGKMPFQGPNIAATMYKIIHETPPAPSTICSDVPEWLDHITERALAKVKSNRYSSATEFLKDLKQGEPLRTQKAVRWSSQSSLSATRRFGTAAIAIVVLLALGLLGYRFFKRQAKIRWAREQALPKIEKVIQEGWADYTEPYKLAVEAEKYIPGDAKLAELFKQCSVHINVNTDPEGARIYLKKYAEPEAEWDYLGISPLQKIRLPKGIFRWKMEKEGYETVLAAATTFDVVTTGDISGKGLLIPKDILRVLDRTGKIPTGMVHVAGAETEIGKLKDFYIDRYEVTNRQFQEFVDGGGYTNRKYWKVDFSQDRKEITWEEAMSEMVDQTDRPGPAVWEGGAYPQGEEDYPVFGISWYEAAAYAEFAGKSLPTVYHWGLARGESTPLIQWPQLGGFGIFAPFSNFGGKGPVRVGSLPGITSYGAYDMAGNVREWCWNETDKGRSVRGGAWNDNTYMFEDRRQADPLNRSSKNGFRCVLYSDSKTVPEAAFAKIQLKEVRDYYHEEPVSDSIFQVYKDQFSYDPSDLNARVEFSQKNPGGWTHEKVSYNAAYSGERILAHLFLPEKAKPPYQSIIYFPGSGSIFEESSDQIEKYFEFTAFLSFLVQNGRAVLYPVYKGTFERRDLSFTLMDSRDELSSHQYAEFVIQQVKDFRRSIDYLETREDVDRNKLAYYGMSWGAWFGAIIPAVDSRLQASVLVAGGLKHRMRPEVDQLNYVTRIDLPTLMINGRFDTIVPFETSIKPMYDLLGTPKEHKELKLYETDHIPPRKEYIKKTLSWLDRYLGPVQR